VDRIIRGGSNVDICRHLGGLYGRFFKVTEYICGMRNSKSEEKNSGSGVSSLGGSFSRDPHSFSMTSERSELVT
jgi:hypothetical protein